MDKNHSAGAGRKAEGKAEKVMVKVQSSMPMIWLLGSGALLFIAALAFRH